MRLNRVFVLVLGLLLGETAQAGWNDLIISGGIDVAIVDGTKSTETSNFDITAPRYGAIVIQDGSAHVVLANPYGYDIDSKTSFGGGLGIGYRLSRRLTLFFEYYLHLGQEGGQTLEYENLYIGQRLIFDHHNDVSVLRFRTILEINRIWRHAFLIFGREGTGFWVRRTTTWREYQGGSLIRNSSEHSEFIQSEGGWVGGVGWSQPLSPRWSLSGDVTFVTGDINKGTRLGLVLRFRPFGESYSRM